MFLNDNCIQEEVYIDQPLGYINPSFPNRVFKLKKALYNVKKAHNTSPNEQNHEWSNGTHLNKY